MILLFSGGRDSALLAVEYLDKIDVLMHFVYDHPAQVEEALSVDLIYKLLKKRKPSLSLVVYKVPIQAQAMHIGAGERGFRVVPCRNAIMLSMAANYALSNGMQSLMFGANLDDFEGYEDCRPSYLESIAGLMGVKIETPLASLSKKEISKRISRYSQVDCLSWSCYEPSPITGSPCGRCDSCLANK